jgi:hypothetical protein
MLMSEHVRSLRSSVAAIAALGDPATAAAGERIAVALEGTFRVHLLDVLAEAVQEIDAQVTAGRVDLRIEAGEPVLVFTGSQPDGAAEATTDDPASARITLRIAEGLKTRAEEAAAREGMSLNTWLARAVGRAVAGDPPRTSDAHHGQGRRLQGWAES